VRALELAAILDHDFLGGLARVGANSLDPLDNVHSLGDGAEDDVLSVQPGGLCGAEEELGAVGPGSGVGHGQDSGSLVLQGEVLVGELGAVDRLATGAVVVGEVSTLAHEVRDNPVKGRSLESKSLLVRAKSPEVLGSLGHDIGTKLHDNTTGVGSTDGDIKEASWIGHLDKDVVDLKGFRVWFHKTSAAYDGKESSD